MSCEGFWKAISAIGTFGIGVGTLMFGYAACEKLPKAAKDYTKAAEVKYNAAKFERQNKIHSLASEINRNVRKLATDNNFSPEDKKKALSEIKILEPEFKAIFRDSNALDALLETYKDMDQTLKTTPTEETKLKIDESIEAVNKLTEPFFKAAPSIEKHYPNEIPPLNK